MSDKQVCENCKHYKPVSGYEGGLCGSVDSYKLFTPAQSSACSYFVKGRKTVKPRRLCDFCERMIPVMDDYGRYTMESVKTESCPTVNLTTGERTEPDENGEYVLLIFDENGHGIDPGMFPIKFCPYCGRKLGGEKDG